MTAVAANSAPEDDAPLPPRAASVDLLATRIAQAYGVDPGEVRDLAVAALAAFAGARVQAFVPILVEKRLRETYRGRR